MVAVAEVAELAVAVVGMQSYHYYCFTLSCFGTLSDRINAIVGSCSR